MVVAMPVEREQFYTPQTVERLLRQLPYLLDRTAPLDDAGMSKRGKRTSPAGRLEEQMAKRADVEWALQQLPDTWYRVVYLTCVGDKTWADVASIIGKSERTVAYRKQEGLRMMAWLLGWRDSAAGYGPENADAVRRRLFAS